MPDEPGTRRSHSAHRLLRNVTTLAMGSPSRVRRFLELVKHSRTVRRRVARRAVTLALLAAVALGSAHNHSDAMRLRARWGPSTSILVAERALDAGSRIGPGDLTLREVPAALAPPDTLGSVPPGTELRAAVPAGWYLHEQHLAPVDGPAPPPGSVAVRVDPVLPPPLLDVGDHVDVVGAPVPGGHVTTVAVRAIVLATPTDDNPTLEVAVSPGEAGAVTRAGLGSGVAVLRRTS